MLSHGPRATQNEPWLKMLWKSHFDLPSLAFRTFMQRKCQLKHHFSFSGFKKCKIQFDILKFWWTFHDEICKEIFSKFSPWFGWGKSCLCLYFNKRIWVIADICSKDVIFHKSWVAFIRFYLQKVKDRTLSVFATLFWQCLRLKLSTSGF